MKPVVLIFGLSGAGKSTLATWLSQELHLVHINFDDWDHLGIDGQPLQRDFDTFIKSFKGQRLHSDITAIISKEQAAGSVLTFPSDIVPSIANLNEARAESMTPIILFGSKSDCFRAYLKRDQASEHPLPPGEWPIHNDAAYEAYCRPEYGPFAEVVFPRRSKESLIKAVQARFQVST